MKNKDFAMKTTTYDAKGKKRTVYVPENDAAAAIDDFRYTFYEMGDKITHLEMAQERMNKDSDAAKKLKPILKQLRGARAELKLWADLYLGGWD